MSTAFIEILRGIRPPLRWEPIPRDWIDEFFSRKEAEPGGPTREDLESKPNSTLFEAQRVLGRCLPPTEPSGSETGLVVGYVQSGKTLSFTTVITLARDNGYGLVIVLAGTKDNLREQSERRLRKDLGIELGEPSWQHFSNPRSKNVNDISRCLTSWEKKKDKKKAALITVLKQKDHLQHLASVLAQLRLSKVPALVIDDEGDQASLNNKANANLTKKSNEQSKIYECIVAVRKALPHHSYLQYTATPQANLLLAQSDFLDPAFAELLTPGDAYTGGTSFFGKGSPALVSVIPQADVTSALSSSRAPKSLLQALRFFLLAAAHHNLTRKRGKDANRSMMVHPAAQTNSHKVYKRLVDRAVDTFEKTLPDQWQNDPESVRAKFHAEFASLQASFPDIQPLDHLLTTLVDDVLAELRVVEVNSTQEAEKTIDWKANPYWVLVGGQKLDRGYTVEGLCVTYMPRGLSKTATAADTLQQRARFFGYKKAYLGLCRTFLPADVKDAFEDYVEHEESIRKALERFRGHSLREWRRAFVLDESLRPTRRCVVGRSVRQVGVNGWIVPRCLHRAPDAVDKNRKLLTVCLSAWTNDFGPRKSTESFDDFRSPTGKAKHLLLEGVPLRRVLADLLLSFEVVDPKDAALHSAALVVLSAIVDVDSEATTDVFLINGLEQQYRTREAERSGAVSLESPINNYFSQSANTVNDKSLKSEQRVAVHLRRFKLGTEARSEASADVFDVPWFAVYVPSALRRGVLVEAAP